MHATDRCARAVLDALLDEAPAHCSVDEIERLLGDAIDAADGIQRLSGDALVHHTGDGRFWFPPR